MRWRKVRNETVRNLGSFNTIRVIKSRRKYIGLMGEMQIFRRTISRGLVYPQRPL
jgi:hypothetical protein